MRVFRTSYKDRTGQVKQAKKWYIELRDHLQTVRRFPAFTDKTQSESLGRQIERLVRFRVAGEQPDLQLSRWLEQIPAKLRDRLAKIGLLDLSRAAAAKPLTDHVADFQQALTDKGNTPAQIDLTIARVKRIIEGCKFHAWSDISANAVSRYLNDLESIEGISKRTRNYYLKAIKHFCRWMVKQRKATESPLEHLDCVSVKTDETRHNRRALSADEIRRLLEITATQPERFGMSGTERRLLYKIAVESGLRAAELRSLTTVSFDFERRTVTVESQHTKNHKEAVLSLRADTAAELKQFLAGKLPNVKAFGGTYKRLADKTHLLIKADLEAAGIPYVDESGRYADFPLTPTHHRDAISFCRCPPEGCTVPYATFRHKPYDVQIHSHTHRTRGAGGGIPAGLFAAEHRSAKSNYDRDRQRKKLGVLLGASGRKTADDYGRYWTDNPACCNKKPRPVRLERTTFGFEVRNRVS